jgi:predicted nucleotidyltransferase
MKLICKYYGGSHSYGLNTPSSDLDHRGVYINDDLAGIINPSQNNSDSAQVTQNKDNDVVFYEIRRYLSLLKKANTQSIEMLFNNDWVYITDEFQKIQAERWKLIDPEKVFNSIQGYGFSEYKKAIGSTTGKLGGQRKLAVETYNFSPKNWVNLLRIYYCGERFFKTGVYPVSLEGTSIHTQLMELKTKPEQFTLDRLNEMFTERQKEFNESWEKQQKDIRNLYYYDDRIATNLIFNCYRKGLLKLAQFSLRERLFGC